MAIVGRLVDHQTGARLGDRHAQRSVGAHHVGSHDFERLDLDRVALGNRIEQPGTHRPTGGIDRAARHPRLARRGGRPRRVDRGVDRFEHHVGHAEARAGDLLGQRDEPLADLGGRELEGRDPVGQAAPGSRVVVESLGVHEVLDRHAEAHAASHVRGIGREAHSPRQEPRIGCIAAGTVRRHRQRNGLSDATLHRSDRVDHLAGDQAVAGHHRVPQANLHRVETARFGEAIHLRLVREARLHHTETTHRATRRVVRTDRPPLDRRVQTAIRPLRVRDRIEQHRVARGCVGAAVEHHARLDSAQRAVPVGVVTHPDRRRMTMHVSEEGLLAGVLHTHRTARVERKQRGVHLQAEVFATAECAAHARHREANPLGGQAEARGELLAILVQPLGRDEQLHASAVGVGDAERRLEPEERLVLHTDLVGALDPYLADEFLIATRDVLATEHVAARVQLASRPCDHVLGVRHNRQRLPLDHDRSEGTARRLRMVGSDQCDRLALIPHHAVGRDIQASFT